MVEVGALDHGNFSASFNGKYPILDPNAAPSANAPICGKNYGDHSLGTLDEHGSFRVMDLWSATNQEGTTSVGTITIAHGTTVVAIGDANGGVHQVTDYLSNSNLAGWTLTNATGISDVGKVVVGNGLNCTHSVKQMLPILTQLANAPLRKEPANVCGDGGVVFFEGEVAGV